MRLDRPSPSVLTPSAERAPVTNAPDNKPDNGPDNGPDNNGQGPRRALGSFSAPPPGGSPLDRRIADNLAARGIITGTSLSSSPRPIASSLSTPDQPGTAGDSQPACCQVETPAERRTREQLEQARAARRVLIAFLLVLLLVPVVLFVAVVSEIEIPMVAIFALFGLVLVGAMAAGAGRTADRPSPSPPQDEGRPIGCCSGPRPMRRFRE